MCMCTFMNNHVTTRNRDLMYRKGTCKHIRRYLVISLCTYIWIYINDVYVYMYTQASCGLFKETRIFNERPEFLN